MSSLVGHALFGVSCLELARSKVSDGVGIHGYWWMAGFVIVACLPDLDFFAGFILANNFHQFHSGPSHSLFAVVLTVMVIGFVLPLVNRNHLFPWLALAAASHVAIDLFTGPQLGWQQSYGVALYWPFDEQRVRMPISLFYGVRHATMDALLSWYNFKVVITEAVSFGLMFLLLRSWTHARISTAQVE